MRVFTLVHWMPLSVDAMCKKILSLTAKIRIFWPHFFLSLTSGGQIWERNRNSFLPSEMKIETLFACNTNLRSNLMS